MVLKRTLPIQIAAMLLLSASPAVAAETVRTSGSATIEEAAGVKVITNGPLQILLSGGSIAPSSVTFTVSSGGGSVGVTGLIGGNGPSTLLVDGAGGLFTGTTLNGDTLSVSVGSELGNMLLASNTGDEKGLRVVIAQYN